MDDIERLERIDRLASRMLNREGEERPATEVWDEAAEIVDEREDERQRLLVCGDCQHTFDPGRMRRYGDHACPRCGSLFTGRSEP